MYSNICFGLGFTIKYKDLPRHFRFKIDPDFTLTAITEKEEAKDILDCVNGVCDSLNQMFTNCATEVTFSRTVDISDYETMMDSLFFIYHKTDALWLQMDHGETSKVIDPSKLMDGRGRASEDMKKITDIFNKPIELIMFHSSC